MKSNNLPTVIAILLCVLSSACVTLDPPSEPQAGIEVKRIGSSGADNAALDALFPRPPVIYPLCAEIDCPEPSCLTPTTACFCGKDANQHPVYCSLQLPRCSTFDCTTIGCPRDGTVVCWCREPAGTYEVCENLD